MQAPASQTLQLTHLASLIFTAEDLPEVPFDYRVAPSVDIAAEFLLGTLAAGPRESGSLLAECEAERISRSSLYRARHRLGVRIESGQWALPV